MSADKQEVSKIVKQQGQQGMVADVITQAPTRAEMARWNDGTFRIDITNNIAYFKYKEKFKKWNLSDV